MMNGHKHRNVILLAAASLAIAPVATLGLGGMIVPWWTVDGGGTGDDGPSMGGSYTLSGTIGQYDTGFSAGGSYTLSGGFRQAAPKGDLDGDGVVGEEDYPIFEDCLEGPEGEIGPGCGNADMDDDGDVDLDDFALFQDLFEP